MKSLLANYYSLQVNESITMNGNSGYKNNEYSYFIIRAHNNKAIQMEQIVLAHYLYEVGYQQVALPIQNKEGEWVTPYSDNHYIVVQVKSMMNSSVNKLGVSLAQFHDLTTAYPYEPESISSYGQWKGLWIDKLTQMETNIEATAKERSSNYFRMMMDLLPYLIGISENAIQYMQETEQEQRFDLGDQATITFFRFDKNTIDSVIWPSEIFYDHPVRDIAEYIRKVLLNNDDKVVDQAMSFIDDYQEVRLLSPFSFRLLYARLLFPVHIFDPIATHFIKDDKENNKLGIENVIINQPIYEQNLRRLFDEIERNNNHLHIPMLHWL